MQKVLNLYAGLGGNRKNWPASLKVTAIENNPIIAAAYRRMYPADRVIVTDAHEYLLHNLKQYDFVWSSPPCQSHSRMVFVRGINRPAFYPDMNLYSEIIMLQRFCRVPWVVENVVPFYGALMPPAKQLGRHLFWSNFSISPYKKQMPADLYNMKTADLLNYLGLDYIEKIRYRTKSNYTQVLRNCVHPEIGVHIFNCANGDLINKDYNQQSLFTNEKK